MLNKILYLREKQSNPYWIFISGLMLVGVIGYIDLKTGFELGISVFYILPIAYVTWHTTQSLGVLTSFISAAVWIVADIGTGHEYSNDLYPVWNTIIRVMFFLLITVLLSALKKAMQKEVELGRTDALTGAVNSRYFRVLLAMEMDRFDRYKHPFTIAFIDLDNFKEVNDTRGHAAGDKLLREVVDIAKDKLRKSDVVARLGGDEFALLMPETDADAAKNAVSSVQKSLMFAMFNDDIPVTFSIGVLTCYALPAKLDEVINRADQLMYKVKQRGKNGIEYQTYSEK
jgi:diguanylate cyclase (GGDEF)-like protein